MYEGSDTQYSSYSCSVIRTPKKRVQVAEPEGGYTESKKVSPPSKDVVVLDIKTKVLRLAQNERTSYPVEVASDTIDDDMYESLMVKLEADPSWKTCRCKMKLIDGRVVLIRIPDVIHEVISRQVTLQIGMFNDEMFLPLGSSRVRYGQPNTCLESDESFVNNHAIHVYDQRQTPIPTIVVEAAYSENYESIQATALQYLYNDNVRMVISIKALANQERRVTQLYCIVHTRNENNQVITSQVISFGPHCHHQTINAIFRNTNVHPDNFIGIGRPGFEVGVNYPAVLNDEDIFSVIVPNEVIWWNVPEEVRFAIEPLRLRLNRIVASLQRVHRLI